MTVTRLVGALTQLNNIVHFMKTCYIKIRHFTQVNLTSKPSKGRGNLTKPLMIKEDTSKPIYTKHDQLFKELINEFFKEFLEAFFPNVYAGFLPLANALKHIRGTSDMVSILLKGLNNFLVRDDNDEILFPGKYGYKCSMDVSTGAAGEMPGSDPRLPRKADVIEKQRTIIKVAFKLLLLPCRNVTHQ